MPLYRNYSNVVALQWIDDNHFVGIVTHHFSGTKYMVAAYGWSKGAGFYIYTISNGHIEKLGSIKRDEIIKTT